MIDQKRRKGEKIAYVADTGAFLEHPSYFEERVRDTHYIFDLNKTITELPEPIDLDWNKYNYYMRLKTISYSPTPAMSYEPLTQDNNRYIMRITYQERHTQPLQGQPTVPNPLNEPIYEGYTTVMETSIPKIRQFNNIENFLEELMTPAPKFTLRGTRLRNLNATQKRRERNYTQLLGITIPANPGEDKVELEIKDFLPKNQVTGLVIFCKVEMLNGLNEVMGFAQESYELSDDIYTTEEAEHHPLTHFPVLSTVSLVCDEVEGAQFGSSFKGLLKTWPSETTATTSLYTPKLSIYDDTDWKLLRYINTVRTFHFHLYGNTEIRPLQFVDIKNKGYIEIVIRRVLKDA